jgi:hypothetical protein
MMHFILVIFGFWTLLNSRVKLLKTPIYGISFFLIYLLYVLIVSSIFAIDSNVSGIYANDWETGEYSSVKYYINLPYPGIMIVSFLLGIIFGYILVLVFWFLQNKFFGWKLVKTKKIIIPPSYYY